MAPARFLASKIVFFPRWSSSVRFSANMYSVIFKVSHYAPVAVLKRAKRDTF